MRSEAGVGSGMRHRCRRHGRRTLRFVLVAIPLVLSATELWGWSPPPRTVLDDLAERRLDALSFYGVGWLLAVAGARALWNSIGRGRPGHRPLGIRRALGWSIVGAMALAATGLLGAGAAGLIAPGGWRAIPLVDEVAAGFALEPFEQTNAEGLEAEQQLERERRARLTELRERLWRDADRRDGVFPLRREEADVPAELWQQAGFPSVELIYCPGLRRDGPVEPLVIEYDLAGAGTRLVLSTDGAIGPYSPRANSAPRGSEEPR